MTLRHIALFRWQDGVDDAQIAEVERLLGALPAAVPELRSYSFGRDAGVSEGAFDFAVVADVDDEAGFVAYRDHPDHQAALAVIRPLLADRAAIQYPLPG
ncbi:Dabb family protein [Nocardiopsis sp. HNM0947]|uniref:Dabb family protein n=1 Tax=Nocardiopsis coralli TaxID=2772213 RepID=A0ABR9PE29_9ACTN|nr:Dabb family protein [Nocardiopsis coralli]MBE3002072.1 Dabb family protein [Nocardiopsis coralli]